jgi:hypothetical protein
MKIEEFSQLRRVLLPFYLPEFPPVVGYLRGSISAGVWKNMADKKNRRQMMILGNQEPTEVQWKAAGVGHRRGETKAVKFPDLHGFIVLYGGFMVDRPWGSICIESKDASEIGFPGTLRDFEREVRNYNKRQL